MIYILMLEGAAEPKLVEVCGGVLTCGLLIWCILVKLNALLDPFTQELLVR